MNSQFCPGRRKQRRPGQTNFTVRITDGGITLAMLGSVLLGLGVFKRE